MSKKLEKLILRTISYSQLIRTMMIPDYPDFIIIGAQKAGTSSLFAYLSQHPQLLASNTKEIHYFDGGLIPSIDNYSKGSKWYCSHFPAKRIVNDKRKTFEASPLYLFNPLAPKRIFDLIPKVKIIALLRNPIERAISHYFHERRHNREQLSMMEAFSAEDERLKPILVKEDFKNEIFIRYSYKSRGLYFDQIKRYMNYFPRDNILILNSEEFFLNTKNILKIIYDFLEIDPRISTPNLDPHNIGNNRREVGPEIYKYLNNYFKIPNQKLFKFIGDEYQW